MQSLPYAGSKGSTKIIIITNNSWRQFQPPDRSFTLFVYTTCHADIDRLMRSNDFDASGTNFYHHQLNNSDDQSTLTRYHMIRLYNHQQFSGSNTANRNTEIQLTDSIQYGFEYPEYERNEPVSIPFRQVTN